MATLIPALSSCKPRMTSGEKRFAERLEQLLEADYLCWYDVPIGGKQRHPDFVVLHPSRGLLVLEVKDWKLDTIVSMDRFNVTFRADNATGVKAELNPLVKARQFAMVLTNILSNDPQLCVPEGQPHAGQLLFPYGYGVVFSNITRRQFEASELQYVLSEHLLIFKDEMTESVDAEAFQERLWQMFNVQFKHKLSVPQMDRIRWHIFPEIRITQGSLFGAEPTTLDHENTAQAILRVMDIQQEQLARNLGEGHRVIHGVAGSGKTLILGYRCQLLARTQSKPILVLVYNISLAAKLESLLAQRGLSDRVSVRHFHRWCLEQLGTYHIPKPLESGRAFYPKLVESVSRAVEQGHIPRAQYGAVLIDEGHDFEADWLKLITQMLDPVSNSLLLLFDDAQSIYKTTRSKNFSFKSIGIQAQGRTTVLRINYRNTNEILQFAYDFAQEILTPTDADDDGVPLVKPEVAGRHGPLPELLQLPSLRAEANALVTQFKSFKAEGKAWHEMAILYSASFVAEQIVETFGREGLPIEWLKDNASKRFNAAAESIKLMHLKSSKGLEFPYVAIAGVGYLPYQSEVEDARLLYVGMTRATEHLLMTSSRDSIFVQRLCGLSRA